MCRYDFLGGRVQYALSPEVNEKGELGKHHYVEPERLVTVDGRPVEAPKPSKSEIVFGKKYRDRSDGELLGPEDRYATFPRSARSTRGTKPLAAFGVGPRKGPVYVPHPNTCSDTVTPPTSAPLLARWEQNRTVARKRVDQQSPVFCTYGKRSPKEHLMTRTATNLVFLDLETTGLDPKKDVILEIAALPVDRNLELLHEGWSTVVHPVLPSSTWTGEFAVADPHWVIEQHKKVMNANVLEMHTTNGLFQDLADGKGLGIQTAIRDFLRYAEQYVEHGQTPIGGSSVHFDRRFLIRYMPPIDKFFHYRIADVSCIKEFWKRWFPEASEPPKVKAHRALADCYASVAEAKWYKDRLVRVEKPSSAILDR